MRPATYYALFIAGLSLAFALLLVSGHRQVAAARDELGGMAVVTRELQLTDLCIFTEASYTRHPAMTDLGTAFQSAPSALEHFPTGSLMLPPPHLSGREITRD